MFGLRVLIECAADLQRGHRERDAATPGRSVPARFSQVAMRYRRLLARNARNSDGITHVIVYPAIADQTPIAAGFGTLRQPDALPDG